MRAPLFRFQAHSGGLNTLRPMSRIVLLLAAGLIAAALLTGYFSDDSSPTTSTAAEATTAPAATTPTEVTRNVYERSYSECATDDVDQLAAHYRVNPEEGVIATKVARKWTEQFGAGDDAIESGEDGCLQGFREK